MADYIYVALDLDKPKHPYKIGYTSHLKNRLEHMKNEYKRDLEYVHVIQVDDMITTEDHLHQYFSTKRKGTTEFFNLEEGDLEKFYDFKGFPPRISQQFIQYKHDYCTVDFNGNMLIKTAKIHKKGRGRTKRLRNNVIKSYNMEQTLVSRMQDYYSDTGLSQSHIIRRAVETFLDAEGY